jgi:hypothetical protein
MVKSRKPFARSGSSRRRINDWECPTGGWAAQLATAASTLTHFVIAQINQGVQAPGTVGVGVTEVVEVQAHLVYLPTLAAGVQGDLISLGLYKSDIPTGTAVMTPFNPSLAGDMSRDRFMALRQSARILPAVALSSALIGMDLSFHWRGSCILESGQGMQISWLSLVAGGMAAWIRYRQRRIL